MYRSQKVILLYEVLPGESNQPRVLLSLAKSLGPERCPQSWEPGRGTLSQKGSSSHHPRLGWVMGHLFAFPGYPLCSESMSSCNQEIGRPQKMKGKLSKRLSSFSNPAGNGLCVGYWIAAWAQLTHLSHHKSARCILNDIGQINSGIARVCLLLKCKTKMGKLDIGHWPENQELIWNPLGVLLLFSLPWKYNFGYIAYG